jgi:GNAT superfamily N-acetyltransferase
MKLRYANEEDYDFLVKGIKETHIIEKWPKRNLVPKQEKQNAMTAIKKKWIRIAEESGNPIGFIWFEPDFRAMHLDRKDYLWLHLIFIIREWRGKGISKLLIQDLEKIAKNFGRKELIFDIFEINKSSINFFKKLGSKPIYTLYSKKVD